MSSRGKREKNTLGQPLFPFDEATQIIGEFIGQHGDDLPHEISRVAAFLGLFVERATGSDIGADICYMNTDPHIPSGLLFNGERIIEILSIGRINREGKSLAEVETSAYPFCSDFFRQRIDLALNTVGKLGIEFILMQQCAELSVGCMRFTQGLDNFTLWVEVTIDPFIETNDDLLIRPGNRPQFATLRIRDNNIIDQSRFIWNDVVTGFIPLKGSGQGLTGSLKDTHNRDKLSSVLSISTTLFTARMRWVFKTTENMISMESCACVFRTDGQDLLFFR